MLIQTHMLVAFLAASLLLAVTPGPGVVYIVTRSLSQGRASGLASVCGVALGNFANAVAASIGLATLLAMSSLAFTVMKWVGAAYLLYLGIRMWRKAPLTDGMTQVGPVRSLGRIFGDGFTVALLNPKTALFFAAFLPQFLDPHANPLTQSILLGALFVGIAFCTDAVYALAASAIAVRLSKVARTAIWGNRMAGASFVGLAALTALGSPPNR